MRAAELGEISIQFITSSEPASQVHASLVGCRRDYDCDFTNVHATELFQESNLPLILDTRMSIFYGAELQSIFKSYATYFAHLINISTPNEGENLPRASCCCDDVSPFW